MKLVIINVETNEKISRDIFSNCGAFKNPNFRPQPGEIIVSDENMWYELIRFVWTYEEGGSQYAVAYIKQVSSEIKKDILLIHYVPFTFGPSRNMEYFMHYQDYIKRELPYIKHIFVPDKESGKFTIECIQPSDVPQELLEKCISLQEEFMKPTKE